MKTIKTVSVVASMLILGACGSSGGGSNSNNGSSGAAQTASKTFYFPGMEAQSTGNPSKGLELYKTDGSAAGTTLVKDLNTSASTTGGTKGSSPYQFASTGSGRAIFTNGKSADDANGRRALWQTDGTAAGTEVLVEHGTTPGFITGAEPLAVIDGNIVYKGRDANSRQLVYVYDAADQSHRILVDELGSMDVDASVFDGEHLYFLAKSNDPDAIADKLYKTDGNSVVTLETFNDNDGVSSKYLAKIGSRLFFTATINGEPTGQELWAHNQALTTPVKRELVYDINTGSGDTIFEKLLAVENKLFVVAKPNDGSSLWAPYVVDYSQTPASKQKVLTTNVVTGEVDSRRPIFAYKGSVYFATSGGNGNSGANTGGESWYVSDGVSNNTYPVFQGASNIPQGFIRPIGYFGQVNGKMIIKGDDGRIFASNGTAEGTKNLFDSNNNEVRPLFPLNDYYAQGQRLLEEKPSYFVSKGQLVFIGEQASYPAPRLYKTNGQQVSLVSDQVEADLD